MLAPERIGHAALRASFNVAAGASPCASYACVDTWLTDFRGDLPKIDVPTLVLHGTADRILPFEATAARLRDENLIADLTVVEVENGPHNIGWTHPEETNGAMLTFLNGEAEAAPRRPQPRRWRRPPPSGHGEGGPAGTNAGRPKLSTLSPARRRPGARPTEQEKHPPMRTESKELRLALLTLLLPLYIAVVFAANYFGALPLPSRTA